MEELMEINSPLGKRLLERLKHGEARRVPHATAVESPESSMLSL
jgi:hypothetical protein